MERQSCYPYTMTIDPLLISVVADIVTDLSAAAFAAVLIVPISVPRPREENISLAILNLLLGIFGLAVAWLLRMLVI